jgi:hypothetical protein
MGQGYPSLIKAGEFPKKRLILLPVSRICKKFFSCVAGEFVVNHKILEKRKINPKQISAVLD